MAKKNISDQERLIDLLQKQLIIMLYKEGVTRDEITKILSISPNKASGVIKYLSKSK